MVGFSNSFLDGSAAEDLFTTERKCEAFIQSQLFPGLVVNT